MLEEKDNTCTQLRNQVSKFLQSFYNNDYSWKFSFALRCIGPESYNSELKTWGGTNYCYAQDLRQSANFQMGNFAEQSRSWEWQYLVCHLGDYWPHQDDPP
jgi:hypothetical protein